MCVFFGGQTVTFGRVISHIECVSMVVLIGLSLQDWIELYIITAAPVNPTETTKIQNILEIVPLVVEMYARPWTLDDSRKLLMSCILFNPKCI